MKKLKLTLSRWEGLRVKPVEYTVFETHTGYVLISDQEPTEQFTMAREDAVAFAKMVLEGQEAQAA